MFYYTPKQMHRFWQRVDQSQGEDSCWNWIGNRFPSGYGLFDTNKKNTRRTHRIAWELTNGEIPDGIHVLHRCDNPSCCNPKHLFLGTHADNMRDRDQKGRNHTGKSIGEAHGGHKLTWEQVEYIRQRYAAGGITQKKMGIEMGVSQATIWFIVSGKHWRT